jgi:hypothetical protein
MVLEKYEMCKNCQIHHHIKNLYRLSRNRKVLIKFLCFKCIKETREELAIKYNNQMPIGFK